MQCPGHKPSACARRSRHVVGGVTRTPRRATTTLCRTILSTLLVTACTGTPRLALDGERSNDPSGHDVSSDGVTPTTTSLPELDLSLCPMRVSNAPDEVDGKVSRRSPLACVEGVDVLVAPAPGACLSSGFGPRSGRSHRGVDYHSRPAVNVVAAAAGTIRVAEFREKDFGNWVVIDHGGGTHTGYAHLGGLAAGVRVGEAVASGQTLGRMGSTGRASRAVHLHYEIRRGDFDTPRRWWGLEPLDPFAQPARCAPGN